MIGLLGEYEATIDSKGRFLLPGGLKKQLSDNETLVINRGIEKCLTLYPSKTWEALSDSLSKLNDFDEDTRTFKTILLRGASYAELDSAGRILLPPTLKNLCRPR